MSKNTKNQERMNASYSIEEMKILYDKETDTLTITLRDEKIKESDEVRPGVIADFGFDDQIVRFEILSASKVVSQPKALAYELLESPPDGRAGIPSGQEV